MASPIKLLSLFTLSLCFQCSISVITTIRPMKKLAIQPIYAYKFTSTSHVRVRGPQDTTVEFTAKGKTRRIPVSDLSGESEFETTVPVTERAVLYKSENASEQMMFFLGDSLEDYPQETYLYGETDWQVGITTNTDGQFTTYSCMATRDESSGNRPSRYIQYDYKIQLEQNGEILSNNMDYISFANNREAGTFDIVLDTLNLRRDGVAVKGLYLEVRVRPLYSVDRRVKWWIPIL